MRVWEQEHKPSIKRGADIFQQFTILVAFSLSCVCIWYLSNVAWDYWRKRQFKLWDLLVVFTLVASLMGLVIGLTPEDQSGGRPHRFHYYQWFKDGMPKDDM